MHSTLNSPPASTPKCSKKWNYRKSGLTKHKKSKKERRVINKELRALKSEVVEIGSEKSEKHLETLLARFPVERMSYYIQASSLMHNGEQTPATKTYVSCFYRVIGR